ncbi:DUF3147 family protein [Parabacteroides sp. FAFU027]|uniref:DUF3147 family protein n=1 Tax=Parabacteroides sp. FAFU027 TaxID=2922715 RepID=UPI001FAF1294|nr:DUF3147 family protein [Parabacteroides sp. FAFU027]
MIRILIKIIITALLVTGISEVGKRFSTAGAILASLPLTSLLAIIWMYLDTKDTVAIGQFSWSIFWIVTPSLVFFIALPLLLKSGLNFWLSLGLTCVITALFYFLFIYIIRKVGIQV